MANNGCQLWDDCETCVYPSCLADKIPSLLIANRKAEVRELAAQGMLASQIAKKLGISRMTIYRYLNEV